MADEPTIDTGNFTNPGATNPGNAAPSDNSKGSRFDSGQYVQQKYNDIYHDVDLYLDNSGDFDNPSRFFINPAAVLGLHICDTVNDWITDGYLTFMYMPEGAPVDDGNTGQSKSTNTAGFQQAAVQNGQTLKSYTFRGDGLDLLRVMIVPNSTDEKNNVAQGIKIGKNDTRWMLSYVFSIYDVEDIIDVPELQGVASTYMKCLKLKFHDVRYQMLLTSNLEYSTAMPKGNLTPNFDSSVAPKQGVLYTGDILRDIFNEALAKQETGGCEEFRIPEDSPNWDKGTAELFYTSPAQSSAAEDIEYIFSHHVGSTELKGIDELKLNDLCMLHTDRATTFGQIEPIVLTPLADFFKKAGSKQGDPGELQKEHFFVTAATDEVERADALYKAPMGGIDAEVDLKTNKYGQIISYSFVDMAPNVNSNMFSSKPVYSVNIGKREFTVEFKGNSITSARKVIAESYVSELYTKTEDNINLFLPTIHKNKKDINIFPTFSANGTNPLVRQRNGLHNLIYTGLFQNACICFKTYGLTWRESGIFIGIDKTAGSADNDYNNKLYGQWFVVKVDHLFQAGAYLNVIYAIKLHRFSDLKETFNNVLVEQPA